MLLFGFNFGVIISRTHTHYASILKWCVKRDVWIVRVDRRGTIAPLSSASVWLPSRCSFMEARRQLLALRGLVPRPVAAGH